MIPIILGAAALGSAAIGVLKGSEGAGNINQANEIGNLAQQRYDRAVSDIKAQSEETNKLAQAYGQLQLDVKMLTIGRFVAFIERIGQRCAESDMQFLEGLEISYQQLQEYKAEAIKAEQFFQGGVQAVLAGTAASQAATSVATSIGVASTGTAISGLSGAAAANATLAWLGGGTLAAGGGGMALGSLVLGGVTIGPALAVSGFMLAGKAEEALTKAREYEAQVNVAIAKINTVRDLMQQVKRQISELSDLLETLNTNAVLSLNELESRPFDSNRDATKFQQVMLLVKALVEIIKTPVLDEQGSLNSASATITAKYRNLGEI